MPDLIEIGDQIPRLTLRDSAGLPFKVNPGPAGGVLYFMRTADCPVCRAHVKRLATLYPELQAAGFSVTVVVPEGGSAQRVSDSTTVPFAVVAGSDSHHAFGLRRVLFGVLQQSGTAVFDNRMNIIAVIRSSVPTHAFPEDDVMSLIQRHSTKPAASEASAAV